MGIVKNQLGEIGIVHTTTGFYTPTSFIDSVSNWDVYFYNTRYKWSETENYVVFVNTDESVSGTYKPIQLFVYDKRIRKSFIQTTTLATSTGTNVAIANTGRGIDQLVIIGRFSGTDGGRIYNISTNTVVQTISYINNSGSGIVFKAFSPTIFVSGTAVSSGKITVTYYDSAWAEKTFIYDTKDNTKVNIRYTHLTETGYLIVALGNYSSQGGGSILAVAVNMSNGNGYNIYDRVNNPPDQYAPHGSIIGSSGTTVYILMTDETNYTGVSWNTSSHVTSTAINGVFTSTLESIGDSIFDITQGFMFYGGGSSSDVGKEIQIIRTNFTKGLVIKIGKKATFPNVSNAVNGKVYISSLMSVLNMSNGELQSVEPFGTFAPTLSILWPFISSEGILFSAAGTGSGTSDGRIAPLQIITYDLNLSSIIGFKKE